MHYPVIKPQNFAQRIVKMQKVTRFFCNTFGVISKPVTLFSVKTFIKEAYEEAKYCVENTIAYRNLSEEEKKTIIDDMLFEFICVGHEPVIYASLRLDEKNREERKAYYSYLEFVYYIDSCFSPRTYQLFQNKGLLFELVYPFYGREAFVLKNESQITECAAFLATHKEVIVKPIADYGGVGVRKVEIEKGKEIEMAHELLRNGECLVEELIIQSKIMSWLNESSVNTVRLCTFRGENGFEILYAVLRVGREGAIVDNHASGGMWINIDISTHRTCPLCLIQCDVFENAIHPDSRKDLSNFEIPDWEGMMELAERASQAFPNDVYIFGWDFAYTDNGWIVIENNAYPDNNQCLLGGQGVKLKELFAPYMKKKDMIYL